MQGDLGKPPEKRLNYKHCFDALFRVSALCRLVSLADTDFDSVIVRYNSTNR